MPIFASLHPYFPLGLLCSDCEGPGLGGLLALVALGVRVLNCLGRVCENSESSLPPRWSSWSAAALQPRLMLLGHCWQQTSVRDAQRHWSLFMSTMPCLTIQYWEAADTSRQGEKIKAGREAGFQAGRLAPSACTPLLPARY